MNKKTARVTAFVLNHKAIILFVAFGLLPLVVGLACNYTDCRPWQSLAGEC